jgi:hypothetical protein
MNNHLYWGLIVVQVDVQETPGSSFMKVGDRVRVKQSVIIYHHPEHRNQPFDAKGLEGEVLEIVREWQGRPVSANLPVQVQFTKKFRGHFREDELEVLS